MSFIVKSKVKELSKHKGMRISGGAWDALDRELEKMIVKGFERAKANGRSTLKASDL